MAQDGDIILGGLFAFHRRGCYPEVDFISNKMGLCCGRFRLTGLRRSQTMAFAIHQINNNTQLLPNVTLGFRFYDTCLSLHGAYHGAMSLVSGRGEPFPLDERCVGAPPVLGIVGDGFSTNSMVISSALGKYRMPQVSYMATCSCLSDRTKFPAFFRTIPHDGFQVRAMLQILRRFGWTWVGMLIFDDTFSHQAARTLQGELESSGFGCLAYVEVIQRNSKQGDYQRIVSVMKNSTARVIISYTNNLISLIKEVHRQNVTGLQWIINEAYTMWLPLYSPANMPYLGGSLGLAIRRGEIDGLQDFWLKLHPGNDPNNTLLKEFWENTFQCRFEAGEGEGRRCSGAEDLGSVKSSVLHVHDLREEYNVYKAVYALAHALHDVTRCVPGAGPFPGHSCARLSTIQPWQLVYYLQKVKFSTPAGDEVSFDENGDVFGYDVMNWVRLPDGRGKPQHVGVIQRSASGHDELVLDEDQIFWNLESKKPPRSVCSESCSPGSRVARRKGEPFCCFDCIACSEGEFSNETDSAECTSCPEYFWSSPQRDHCVPMTVEFLSFDEALGISLTTMSLLGTLICAIVLGIFIYYRDTPMVRANNSELSFQLLLSLKLCFLCSLLFIGRPRLWTCQLRHAVFGISFVLCVSCILVKTMVVLAVFKASKPGAADIMKWFGAMQQRGTVLTLTSIQAVICIAWLVSASPAPHKNTQYIIDKIFYECDVGSTVGFAVLLGYIGLLAFLSFVLAFMARNLPDNFNEAKLITFSMLIFCAVWIAFIPAYISSPGKYADVVEVFAILASSFGLLVVLFGPKCYIILLKPERNTKKSIMGRGANKT